MDILSVQGFKSRLTNCVLTARAVQTSWAPVAEWSRVDSDQQTERWICKQNAFFIEQIIINNYLTELSELFFAKK